MSWQTRTWAGFDWSPWMPLEDVSSGMISSVGLYRIRSLSPLLLVYVGEGKLPERPQYWTRANQKSWESISRSPYPRLWFLTFHRERLGGYEVSWTDGPIDVSDERLRKGHEMRLLWRYRKETRCSSLANHSRATLQLNMVGENTRVGSENLFLPSSSPLEPDGHKVESTRWMGRAWTHLITQQELKHASREDLRGFRQRWMQKSAALYKALGPRLQLRKIGYKSGAHGGLLEVFRDLPDDTIAAWSNLGRYTPKHHCLELKSDLIGAHLQRTGRLPGCQF